MAQDEGRQQTGSGIGDDLVIIIEHPMGTIEVSLSEWIARGPGPRDRLRPAAVRSRATGEALPLSVIPAQYRNDSPAP